jgi:hypothetical protein
MGCDIHSIYEVKITDPAIPTWSIWYNAGEPVWIHRNYSLFGILAGMRRDDVPRMAMTPHLLGLADHLPTPYGSTCNTFRDMMTIYGEDAHTHGYVTLANVLDFEQEHGEFLSPAFRASYDFVADALHSLIADLKEIRQKHGVATSEVRLSFFFDN